MRIIISFFIALLPAFPLGAQLTEPSGVDWTTSSAEKPYRDPRRALVLGTFIPGAGHIYAGEYWKGIGTYEGTVGSIGMGAMVFILGKCGLDFSGACKPGPEWPYKLLGGVGVGSGIWIWVSSARDAPRAAKRANARHGAKSQTVTPIINLFSGPANASQIGVAVHW